MNILKYAWRTVTRLKAYSVICIVGLVISLAGTFTIVRYIHQEISVDDYLPEADRLCLLSVDIERRHFQGSHKNANNESQFVSPVEHPAVEAFTGIYLLPGGEVVNDRTHYAVRAIAVDSLYLRLFPREAKAGRVSEIPPTGILISEELAARIFGEQNPIGRPLTFGGKPVTVTGVLKRLPTKSSLCYDVIVSDQLHKRWIGPSGGWEVTLARLHRGKDLQALNDAQPVQNLRQYGEDMRFRFIPLKEIYFDEMISCYGSEDDMFPKGDRASNHILVFVAILLFIIGWFNYLNLYTVIMQKRGLEFGVKKVYGAGRAVLFGQLYTENLLLSAGTMLCVATVIELSDRFLNDALGIPIQGNPMFDTLLGISMLLGFPLLVTLYPYFRYLHRKPVSSMKGLRGEGRSDWSRSIFLLVQYAITFCLLVVSIYFARQLHFMLNAELGFHTQDILQCRLLPRKNTEQSFESNESWEQTYAKAKAKTQQIARELDACPYIQNWAIAWGIWEKGPYNAIEIKRADSPDAYQKVELMYLSPVSFDIYDLQVVEGRAWNDSTDTFASYNILISESAKRALGIDHIDEALIQTKERIWWSYDTDRNSNPPFTIVGVVKDFKNRHLATQTMPMVFGFSEARSAAIQPGTPIVLRIQPGKQAEVLALLTSLRNEMAGEGELEYNFLEDDIAAAYANDRRVVNIYLVFATLAIGVSCLGLFGLSLFEIRLRYREIALRKVHGAHTRDIVRLLFRRYVWLLAASVVVALPIVLLFIHEYMKGYAHRTPLSPWIFLAAIGIIALFSFSVLYLHIRKAASINPAEVMKRE